MGLMRTRNVLRSMQHAVHEMKNPYVLYEDQKIPHTFNGKSSIREDLISTRDSYCFVESNEHYCFTKSNSREVVLVKRLVR